VRFARVPDSKFQVVCSQSALRARSRFQVSGSRFEFGIWNLEFGIWNFSRSAGCGLWSVVSSSKVEHHPSGDLMGFSVLVQNAIDGHAPIVDTHTHRTQKTA